MIFCDTSIVAKLYVREAESKAVLLRLETEDVVYVSELVRPELMAVFHRRLREGKWTRADFAAAVRQFSSDDLGGSGAGFRWTEPSLKPPQRSTLRFRKRFSFAPPTVSIS